MFSASDCVHIPTGRGVLFADLHFRIPYFGKISPHVKNDVQTPSGMACIQPSMRPTYISYLLKQTDSGGEIANWTQCPNKCLHVVQGQRSWATKPIHIARQAWHRGCVHCLLLNAYWTIHLFFSYGVYYGVLCKKYFRKQCGPTLLNIIVADKTNKTKCSFPVLKFSRTAKQKLCNTMHLFLSNYILSIF